MDTLIYNLGLWEAEAFEAHYSFLDDHDAQLQRMVDCNITATILLIKRLPPLLLKSENHGSFSPVQPRACPRVVARK